MAYRWGINEKCWVFARNRVCQGLTSMYFRDGEGYEYLAVSIQGRAPILSYDPHTHLFHTEKEALQFGIEECKKDIAASRTIEEVLAKRLQEIVPGS